MNRDHLQAAREELDRIDADLVRLFRRRLEIVAELAVAKHACGDEMRDLAREREILAKSVEMAGPDFESEVRPFMENALALSRAHQRKVLFADDHAFDTIAE